MKIKFTHNAKLSVDSNGGVLFIGSNADFALLIIYAINNIINRKELKGYSSEIKKCYLDLIINMIQELKKEVD